MSKHYFPRSYVPSIIIYHLFLFMSKSFKIIVYDYYLYIFNLFSLSIHLIFASTYPNPVDPSMHFLTKLTILVSLGDSFKILIYSIFSRIFQSIKGLYICFFFQVLNTFYLSSVLFYFVLL